MRTKQYQVNLSAEELALCREMTAKGKATARTVTRAHALLLAHEGLPDKDVAAALHIGARTVGRTRKRYAQEGLEGALYDRRHPGTVRTTSWPFTSTVTTTVATPAMIGAVSGVRRQSLAFRGSRRQSSARTGIVQARNRSNAHPIKRVQTRRR